MLDRMHWLILTAATISLASGCKSTPSKTVVEYISSSALHQKPAPFTDVYELWKWLPAHSQEKKGGPHNTKPVHFEIATAFVRLGTPIGFRRSSGQLIAFAGATTQPLEEAHYSWQTLPGETQHMDEQTKPPVPQSSDGDDDKPDLVALIFDFIGDIIDQAFDNSDDDRGKSHQSHRNHTPDRHHQEHQHDNSKSSQGLGDQTSPTSQPTR